MIQKHPWCLENCGYAKDTSTWRHGVGFVPGEELSRLSTAKVFFLLEAPWKEEIRYSRPLSGNTGRMFFEEFVEPLGYSRIDCLIDNTIRCNNTSNNKQKYPIGQAKAECESKCRNWDVLLYLWKPTIVRITFHPASLFEERSHQRLIEETVQKAFEDTKAGERPLVLMGEKAKVIFAQRLPQRTEKATGQYASMKVWQGHKFTPKPDEWPWLVDETMKPMEELLRQYEK